ncbi:MBL fold metallo-hydrolase [Halococcoides cellulosivorans]|uniref:MBL fold metallo-hydrolase n=1 Tax=Halococcoides cellulosivorans TaxID=1679096 RepID=A0A2R4X2Q4_9EURY|nr:MBL fold metallo-hydrolase [Halococcoides cellulosivorans]AWB28076.1 MBL fold metallo-hydrolase [Halococcoides cellulosivorans]
MAVTNLTADADVFTSNAFLVTGAETTLVDPGADPAIVDALRARVDTLDRIVVTHQDSDHVDQLGAVVEAFDPAVYTAAEHPHRTHTLASGDELLVGDETVRVVETPGHADDHVSLVGSDALYSGDVVVYADGAFDDGSFGRTDRPYQSRERLIESIERLIDVTPASVAALYPGHGPSYEGDVRAVLDRALERAERREPKYD